jgi:hypothetical protein
MDIIKCIMKIYPDWKGSVVNNSYEGIELAQGENRKPTLKELKLIWPQVERETKRLSYIKNRMSEYPPISEQLDALWKGGKESEEMKNKILAIKAKYPKPTK